MTPLLRCIGRSRSVFVVVSKDTVSLEASQHGKLLGRLGDQANSAHITSIFCSATEPLINEESC